MRKVTVTFECPDDMEGVDIIDSAERFRDLLQEELGAGPVQVEFSDQRYTFP